MATLRKETVDKMRAIVASDQDPLSTVAGWIVDPSLDMQTRLSAASIALPFLYPKLSASTVDARHTVTHVDAGAVLAKINEQIERLAQPDPAPPVLIDVKADDIEQN